MAIKDSETIPSLEIGEPVLKTQASHADALITVTPPLSSFHYHLGKVSQHIMKLAIKLIMDQPWRLPYYEQAIHQEFRTFIYSFTWVWCFLWVLPALRR
jgi:betaine lipid synthase